MQLRVESSVTLNVGGHFIKELRSLELDMKDALRLLVSDPEVRERYEDLEGDVELTYEGLLDAFDSTFAVVRESLWDALSDQLEDLKGG